jgi:lipoprotein signal peptidase
MSVVIALAFAVDQESKVFVLLLLPHWLAKLTILHVFDLMLAFNPGVTFGLLSDVTVIGRGPRLLVAGSVAVCARLTWCATRV